MADWLQRFVGTFLPLSAFPCFCFIISSIPFFVFILISTFNKMKTYHFQEPSFFAFLYSNKNIIQKVSKIIFTVNINNT